LIGTVTPADTSQMLGGRRLGPGWPFGPVVTGSSWL
jgi:hypothetical protein